VGFSVFRPRPAQWLLSFLLVFCSNLSIFGEFPSLFLLQFSLSRVPDRLSNFTSEHPRIVPFHLGNFLSPSLLQFARRGPTGGLRKTIFFFLKNAFVTVLFGFWHVLARRGTPQSSRFQAYVLYGLFRFFVFPPIAFTSPTLGPGQKERFSPLSPPLLPLGVFLTRPFSRCVGLKP